MLHTVPCAQSHTFKHTRKPTRTDTYCYSAAVRCAPLKFMPCDAHSTYLLHAAQWTLKLCPTRTFTLSHSTHTCLTGFINSVFQFHNVLQKCKQSNFELRARGWRYCLLGGKVTSTRGSKRHRTRLGKADMGGMPLPHPPLTIPLTCPHTQTHTHTSSFMRKGQAQTQIKEPRCYQSAAEESCNDTAAVRLSATWWNECVFAFGKNSHGDDEMMTVWRGKTAVKRQWRLGMRMISMAIPFSALSLIPLLPLSPPLFLSFSFSGHTSAHRGTLGVCLNPTQLQAVWVWISLDLQRFDTQSRSYKERQRKGLQVKRLRKQESVSAWEWEMYCRELEGDGERKQERDGGRIDEHENVWER